MSVRTERLSTKEASRDHALVIHSAKHPALEVFGRRVCMRARGQEHMASAHFPLLPTHDRIYHVQQTHRKQACTTPLHETTKVCTITVKSKRGTTTVPKTVIAVENNACGSLPRSNDNFSQYDHHENGESKHLPDVLSACSQQPSAASHDIERAAAIGDGGARLAPVGVTTSAL